MFHKAIELTLKEGTSLELAFQDGTVKAYDMSVLFNKYPQLKALNSRELFLQGKLMGGYGIIWNDEIDIEAETVYESGTTVRRQPVLGSLLVAEALLSARAQAGLSQSELSERTGIDQSDISKIERGLSNPSVSTLFRLASAMNMDLNISFEGKKNA